MTLSFYILDYVNVARHTILNPLLVIFCILCLVLSAQTTFAAFEAACWAEENYIYDPISGSVFEQDFPDDEIPYAGSTTGGVPSPPYTWQFVEKTRVFLFIWELPPSIEILEEADTSGPNWNGGGTGEWFGGFFADLLDDGEAAFEGTGNILADILLLGLGNNTERYVQMTISSTAGETVTVQCDNPALFVANINVTCNADTDTAQTGTTVTWSANASGGSGSYSYQWSGTDNLSDTTQATNAHAYSTAGNHTAYVTVYDNDNADIIGFTTCANASNTNDFVTITSPPPPAPDTASLEISPSGENTWGNTATVHVGDDIDLRWSSSGASSCTGTGFSTNTETDGSATVSNLATTGDTTYTLQCGTASDSATVTVVDTLSLETTALFVRRGDTATLEWDTGGRLLCKISALTGDSLGDLISGLPSLTGTMTTEPIYGSITYTLECADDGETAEARVHMLPEAFES